jgi:uncharacterized protein (DUF58 family)
MIPNGSGQLPPARDAAPPAQAGRAGPVTARQVPGNAAPASTTSASTASGDAVPANWAPSGQMPGSAGSSAADLGPSTQVAADEVTVDWRPSRHARRLLTLAAAALLLAVLTRNPALAGVAAPPLLLLGMARLGGSRAASARGRSARDASARPGRVSVRVGLTATRMYEGEPVAVDVTVRPVVTPPPGGGLAGLPGAAGPAGSAGTATDESDAAWDTRWVLHPGKGIEPGSATAVNGQAARFAFRVPRWGKRGVGAVDLTLHDRWRLAEGRVSLTLPSVGCYPSPAVQRTEVVLSRLPNRLGEHRARVPGDGAEFAGIREYVPGDRQRAINWPASTRLGRLQVNTFAAERSQDVVLLVDATSDVGAPGESALDLGLRGAAGAARAYLGARDRVGVITYQWGGALWLAPSLGRRQAYKVLDLLLTSDSGYGRGAVFSRLPRAALPPGALAVAFSPLLDGRFVEALRDMRERGFALIVVDVLNTAPPVRRRSADAAAARIWRMEQDAIRFSLRELGVPVVAWDGTEPLDLPLAPYTRRRFA